MTIRDMQQVLGAQFLYGEELADLVSGDFPARHWSGGATVKSVIVINRKVPLSFALTWQSAR